MRERRLRTMSPKCCARAASRSAASRAACRSAASSNTSTPARCRRRCWSGAKSSKFGAGGIMRTITLLAGALALAIATACGAQAERRDVHIAVGGKTALYYLPLTLTERLGYFKDEGLDVRISDFSGGTRSLEAVVGGSADVVAGAYEHTINMQSRKQSFQAFVLSGAAPQISVAISSKLASKYHSPKDLKGLKIGVSAPGSSTNMVINYVLAQGGLKPEDVAIIGVGQSASVIAAMEQGRVDVISQTDPAV